MEKREFFCALCLTILFLDQSDCDWLNCARIVECHCKWSSGKKTASCVRAQLTIIPRLATDIQVLDLHGNSLKELNVDAFASIDLINLQRLNLSSTKLHRIHKDAFRELKILIELDLSNNELHQLSPDTFKGIDRLRLLVLNNNPLNKFDAEQFPPLLYLKTLGISQCQIRRIHPFAFKNLRALETIFVHQNLLSYVHPSTFDLPLLKTLTISENPWYCDCRLRDFYEWFLNANLGNEQISCVGPRSLAEVSWRGIRSHEMVCPPSAVASPSILRVEVGAQITFGCFANGVPKPTVSWFFHQEEVHNKTYENSAIRVHHYDIEGIDAYNNDIINKTSQWVNISISNVTEIFSGEWKCYANSLVGETSAYVNMFLPKAHTATTRVAPEYSIFIVVIGSMLGMIGAGVIAACVCWKARRSRLPLGRSFIEQEKKLLDSSLAASCDRQSIDQGSSYNFEMFDRSLSFDSGDSQRCSDSLQITLEHTGIYPPPPVEFALPAPYGNIFISLRLSSNADEYPDLLNGGVPLPRRSNTCILKSNNDVVPRINAAGSSTWSLPGAHTSNFKIRNNTVTSFPTLSSEFTAL